jgi:glycosyltransferase involved in cell wall biosynthesis
MNNQINFNPVISVVIPMYNAEQTIVKCLDSVISQDINLAIEVVIVNDGSLDNSLKVVTEYIDKSNKNIQLLSQENKGASAARNLGIRKSKAQFIALIDSDDIWLQGKLQKQYDIISKYNVDFVGTLHNNLKLGFPYKVKGGMIEVSFNKLLIRMAPSTITALFKKELIEKSDYYDEKQKYCEDGNLWLRFSKVGKMIIINENFATAGDYKPLFGHSGLSGNMKGMYEGEKKNLKDILKLKYISYIYYLILRFYISLKYYRRLLIVKIR